MLNKLHIHTVDQPETDITTFVLSCDRLDVLEKTLRSFLNTNDYPTKMVIVDDSAADGVFETLVERYGSFCDVVCFPSNRSQWWAMDFMVSYCDTDYIFYLEDDWEFTKGGYMQQSKSILEKHRHIGVIDISWRTFDWQGIDSYEPELIDEMFYYKKLWRISDYHLHWYGWVGSPNLKRRDDLILLGRVEKWHNEWNIDRRFLGLGLKSVFLNGQYVVHLGDSCSKMAGKRPNDGTTPEDYYPAELQDARTYPKFDYLQWDTHWKPPTDITLVSMAVNIGRSDRDFEEHYLPSLTKLLHSRHPIVLYTEEKYFDKIREIRAHRPIVLIKYDINDIHNLHFYDVVNLITNQRTWVTQSDWIKDSALATPEYVPLTLAKQELLQRAMKYSHSSYYYWIDSGICSSFNITEPLDTFYFTKLPKDKFFMPSFTYYTNSEIHGYNIFKLKEFAGGYENYVCRASFFGGTPDQINEITKLYTEELNNSVIHNTIGTEESIYTLLSLKYPELFNRINMETGDIKLLFNTLRESNTCAK
jgi:hypothetical protein